MYNVQPVFVARTFGGKLVLPFSSQEAEAGGSSEATASGTTVDEVCLYKPPVSAPFGKNKYTSNFVKLLQGILVRNLLTLNIWVSAINIILRGHFWCSNSGFSGPHQGWCNYRFWENYKVFLDARLQARCVNFFGNEFASHMTISKKHPC